MPYSAKINRANPSCFLFVIDESGSMDELMESGRSKAQFVADVLNKTLAELIPRCTKADGVRAYEPPQGDRPLSSLCLTPLRDLAGRFGLAHPRLRSWATLLRPSEAEREI